MLKKLFYIYLIFMLLLVILPINGCESRINHTFILKIRLDYIFHALLFSPWMFFYELIKPFSGVKKFNFIIWLFVGILFCIFSESVQYIIPYRTFNINDMIANCSGIFLSVIVFLFTGPKKILSEKINY